MSPAELVYGTEIACPVSWRQKFGEIDLDLSVERRVEFIDKVLPGMRTNAVKNIVDSKKWAKDYNKKAKNREFLIGEYVLKLKIPKVKKFDPTYIGPYKISNILEKGVAVIVDLEGNTDIVNLDNLKKYNLDSNMQTPNVFQKLRSTIPRHAKITEQ
ncbi:hypothetical protein AYI69_g8304 [Smittium culicis]|uniref:Uncharacterized protein n=1 Tax=Smittium culicis TaxID=133412 RepID=A0A1R1XKJ9_9FUNG|nr:hypothetical protein AYI69_g8304 [Smittium culicis]